MAGKTQAEISASLGTGQGELSRFESRDDHRLSTIRRYLESMGGELEVTAVFGDKRISLRGPTTGHYFFFELARLARSMLASHARCKIVSSRH
jgi:hypothetical protein